MTYTDMLRQLGEEYEFMDPRGCAHCGGRAQSDGGIPPRPEPPIDHAENCFVGRLMAGLEELDNMRAIVPAAVLDEWRRARASGQDIDIRTALRRMRGEYV